MLASEPSFVSIAGRRIAYTAVSPAHTVATVLLLPGAESNRLTWYKQLDVFGRAFRTIALDYRDTGDSDPVSEPYTIADLAEDAVAVLAALSVSRVYLVGVSLGGYVALQMALDHPERVAKLVLVSTAASYILPSAHMQEIMAQAQSQTHHHARSITMPDGHDGHDGHEEPNASELLQRLLAALAAPGYFESHPDDWRQVAEWASYRPLTQEAIARQLEASLPYDVSDQLQHIHIPTLVVHGDLDLRVPPEHGRYLAQQITGARLLLYPNTGHLVPLERANEFNRDVLAFL